MNFNKQEIQEFKKIIESIVDVKIANKRITNYISAIVTSVDGDGYVSVVIPPETDKIVTGLLNKTGEVLESGNSVEIATKNGLLSNAWVAIKHGTNNSGGSGSGDGSGTDDYNALLNKPRLSTTSSNFLSPNSNETIAGVIKLHRISKTGDYNDLINTPVIPNAPVNADWNATNGLSQILNKPTLANVALSGNYNDLTNKPTIPTKTSELTNNSGFITANDIPTQLNADWDADSGVSMILNKPTIPSIEGLEKTSNKVAISSTATEEQYPNAKSVYDFVEDAVASIPQGLKIPLSLAKESDLPTTAQNGDYYFIQDMNVTAPDHTGRAWWNDNKWNKVVDQYQSMDGVSITQSGGGEWEVNKTWLSNQFSTVAKTGSYTDLSNKPTFKTINGESLLGNGNLQINSGTWGNISGTLSNQTDLQSALNNKQTTLVSGTNIKTVNGESLLGSGNIVIDVDLPENIVTTPDSSSQKIVTVTPDEFLQLSETNSFEDNTIYNVLDGAGDPATTTIPVGASIIWWGGTETMPNNYMLLEGQSLSKDAYPSLFNVIGYTYGGSGDYFNLPNMAGRIVVHQDGTTEFETLGQTGGSKYLQKHNHGFLGVNGFGSYNQLYSQGTAYADAPSVNKGGNWYGQGVLHIAETGDGDSQNLQPYMVGYYIIKVFEEAHTENLRNLDNEVEKLNVKVQDSITYSTEETIIGTWIDGKPVYRSVVTLTVGSSINTWYTLLNNNINIPIYVYSIFYKTNQYYPLDKSFDFYSENGKIFYKTSDSWRLNSTCIFVVEYTKTTD